MNGRAWTIHEINTLTQLWQERGYTAEVIGRALDRSPHGVRGKAKTLGLRKKILKPEVLKLRKEGCSFKSIATILNTTVNSVTGIHSQAKRTKQKSKPKRPLIRYAGAE